MRFRDFESKVQDLPIFNLNDIRKFDPGFHRRQLVDWQKRGYIQPLAGGSYILADRVVDEGLLFMAANQIYAPSYVSLESALAYHQVIPESVLSVTSVSARKTRQFDSAWGQFSYRSIKPAFMFGYEVVSARPGQKFLIASLEKAVLDYLYLNAQIQAVEDFEGLRWNKSQLQHLGDSPILDQSLKVFDKQALRYRVDALMRYLDA
jgi:predicted transcriptional regulator of viral defense system